MEPVELNYTDPKVLEEAEHYSDWHIDLEKPESSVIFQTKSGDDGKPTEAMPKKIPGTLRSYVDTLRNELRKQQDTGNADSFTIDIGNIRFRVTRIRASRFALRRVRNSVATLEELNLGRDAMSLLLAPEFKGGGLILIAGETGSGKSTTAAATVVARLSLLGGYCLTVESPIECIIEGFHNNGYCEQIEVAGGNYKQEVVSAMRKFPSEMRSIFYFGEVLEEVGAAELVRLMGRGHLVITTIHAKNIVAAIELLVAFAERGGETYARQLVGSNLRAVIHQKLERGKPVVSAFRISEAAKNIISHPTGPLSGLSVELENEKRKQAAQRLQESRARESGGN